MKVNRFGCAVFALMCSVMAATPAFGEDEEPSTYTLTASRSWVRKTVDNAVSNEAQRATNYTNKATNDLDVAHRRDLVAWANDGKNAVTIGTRQADSLIGKNSVVIGNNCEASAENAHAEGYKTHATAWNAHAENAGTVASGNYSHAEGNYTTASGDSAHSEGEVTKAIGDASHAEGLETTATGYASHADGVFSVSSNNIAYTWNGDEDYGEYGSHGNGTYNVNPVNGLDGFYIGQKTVRKHIKENVGNEIDAATNALGNVKRSVTDLRVWRRVCDTWHWKADFQTPQDFLDFANAYNAPQLVYHAEDGGEWGNVNMFWPNGKPKYLITLHAYPEDSLTNRFHFSVYDQTGTNQVSYFYAVASRASATNTYTYAIGGDSKTQPRGENEFVRVATTDVVYNWIQRDGADIAEKTVKTKIANAIKDIDPDAVTARELLDALLSIVGGM